MNIKHFSETKRDNFCNYLFEEFSKDAPNILDEIEKYKKVPIMDFLIYIREKSDGQNLEKYVDEKFCIYFPSKKLTEKVHNKIVKYLEMFIDLSK
jgi:hypothetical protein